MFLGTWLSNMGVIMVAGWIARGSGIEKSQSNCGVTWEVASENTGLDNFLVQTKIVIGIWTWLTNLGWRNPCSVIILNGLCQFNVLFQRMPFLDEVSLPKKTSSRIFPPKPPRPPVVFVQLRYSHGCWKIFTHRLWSPGCRQDWRSEERDLFFFGENKLDIMRFRMLSIYGGCILLHMLHAFVF